MEHLNLVQALDKLKLDRDVAEPFIRRLMERIHEHHPGEDIRLEDVSMWIEVRCAGGLGQVHRMLSDMVKEGVVV